MDQSAPPASASRALSFLKVSDIEMAKVDQSVPAGSASRLLSCLIDQPTECIEAYELAPTGAARSPLASDNDTKITVNLISGAVLFSYVNKVL